MNVVGWVDAALVQPLGLPSWTAWLVLVVLTIAVVNFVTRMLDSGAGASRSKRRVRGDSIIFAGPAGSGKTTAFFKVMHGTTPETVTSMTANEATAALHSEKGSQPPAKPLRVVDFPGHRRLRGNMTAALRRAAGVVFMVDAAELDVHSTAEFLYDLFTDRAFDQTLPPVLIACNKADKLGTMSPERVREVLERELDSIKDTRASLGTEGEDSAKALGLGTPGQKFTFARDAPVDVSFISCSVAKDDLADIERFMREASSSA